jgi:hypothetical protein
MIIVKHVTNPILKFDLDLHFMVKLRPKTSKNRLIFFPRTISARTEQKAVSITSSLLVLEQRIVLTGYRKSYTWNSKIHSYLIFVSAMFQSTKISGLKFEFANNNSYYNK